MYAVLLTITLFLVAGSSVFMSVYGLVSVFRGYAAVIVCMGLGMETGEILTVSYLYRNWRDLNGFTRILYMLIVAILVLLTSVEVIGFLAQSHVSSTHDLRIAETALRALGEEEAVLRKQISIIDTILSGLPQSYVTRRIKERKAAGYDGKEARLLQIERQKAGLEAGILDARKAAGPVFAVARIMGINESNAISLLILLLVLVLEPLSIGLTAAVSATWTAKSAPRKTAGSLDRAAGNELAEFQKRHDLTVRQIMKITGRKKQKTCEEWLEGAAPVPEKALRAVRAWSNRQA